MKGVLITVDAVLAVLLLSALLALSMHAASYFADAATSQTRLEILKSKAEHAINVLLYGEDNRFRCYYGTLPVPACVWNNGADSSFFWVGEKPNCWISSPNSQVSNFLRSLLGCTAAPTDPSTLLTLGFRVCYAGSTNKDDVVNCGWADVNLYVWV